MQRGGLLIQIKIVLLRLIDVSVIDIQKALRRRIPVVALIPVFFHYLPTACVVSAAVYPDIRHPGRMLHERKHRIIILADGPALQCGCPSSAYVIRVILPAIVGSANHSQIPVQVCGLVDIRPGHAGEGSHHSQNEAEGKEASSYHILAHAFSPFLVKGGTSRPRGSAGLPPTIRLHFFIIQDEFLLPPVRKLTERMSKPVLDKLTRMCFRSKIEERI